MLQYYKFIQTQQFKLIILMFIFIPKMINAQVTYSEHVAPIIYENCTNCHRAGEIGPFPLTNYSEASSWASMIKFVTQSKYMPPWSPDVNYSHFVGEKTLTDAEIQTIADWVDNGAPQGDPSLEPPLPNFSTGSQVGTPDLVLQMAQPHNITGNFKDDYRVFVIPSGFSNNKEIASLEFRPGNASVVHHVLFAYDLTGTAAAMDAATSEYGYVSFGDFGFNEAVFLPWIYTPGNDPLVLPEGIGEIIPANADLLIQVHYAPVGIDQTDQSSINVFYKDVTDPIVREIQTGITSPADIIGGGFGSFFIPPNDVKTFEAEGTSNLIGISQVPTNQDISMIGINPHMHLLGKSYEIYAVTPTNDTINLINIPDWDFNWQGAYTFEKMVKIPANSQWFTKAVYDNTSNNPSNPNFPPQTVTWGDNTGDEMLIVFYYYVPYQNGDENIYLGNTRNLQFKLFLEGPYDTGTGEMSTMLNSSNLIPLSQPYNVAPYNYTGSETVSAIPNADIVDWILVQARDKDNWESIIESRACFLLKDGTLMDIDGTAGVNFSTLDSSKRYRFAFYHKSHLGVLTSSDVDISSGSIYDLTGSQNMTEGVQQTKLVSSIYALYGGDYDNNGIINNQDFNLWKSNSATVNDYMFWDVDANGVSNNQDFNNWSINRSKVGDISIQLP